MNRHSATRSTDRLGGLPVVAAVALLLSACNVFDKPPAGPDIYEAVRGMKEQPFNIEGVTCAAAGAGAYECQFSATVVAGYVPGYVGDMRPDYKIVQMRGRFARAGEKWASADVVVISSP